MGGRSPFYIEEAGLNSLNNSLRTLQMVVSLQHWINCSETTSIVGDLAKIVLKKLAKPRMMRQPKGLWDKQIWAHLTPSHPCLCLASYHILHVSRKILLHLCGKIAVGHTFRKCRTSIYIHLTSRHQCITFKVRPCERSASVTHSVKGVGVRDAITSTNSFTFAM